MAYAWVITKDHIADEDAEAPSNANANGMWGPSGCKLTPEEIQQHPERQYFKMYDDDNNLYYEGYLVDLDEKTDEVEFCPLYDFGMPNAGCTYIKYRNLKTGKMEIL